MTDLGGPLTVLAHGGTGGAIAEASFLALPVLLFLLLSMWSKRRAHKAQDLRGQNPENGGQPDQSDGLE